MTEDRIAGRVVLITGAGRGMGAATALEFARRGARLGLVARTAAQLDAVAADARGLGAEVLVREADVTRPGDLEAAVHAVVDRFGRLDVLVANAGVAVNAPLAEGDPDDWERMIDVNLRGVLHGIAAAYPVFLRQGGGHFVTIGSTSAIKWVPGQGVYAASKAAVRALTDVLRQEAGAQGIRTTYIQPGFTATDFIAATRDPEELAALTERRDAMAMPPETIARAVVWAVDQPDDVNVGEITVRPTVQP